MVTRPRGQAGELVNLLRGRGARTLLAPAIALSPSPPGDLDRAVEEAAGGNFAWILFTSANGVEAVFDRLAAKGLALPAGASLVGAVGEGTARALRERGIEPALVPATFTTYALSRAMPRGAGSVLLARADVAPEGMEAAVARKGWTPVRVDAYRTAPARGLPATALAALAGGRVDVVTFTSASTVDGFLRLASSALRGGAALPAFVCIGPVTARAVRDAGFPVASVASPHTIEGLVAAVERAVATAGRRAREAG